VKLTSSKCAPLAEPGKDYQQTIRKERVHPSLIPIRNERGGFYSRALPGVTGKEGCAVKSDNYVAKEKIYQQGKERYRLLRRITREAENSVENS